jgi:putative transposase
VSFSANLTLKGGVFAMKKKRFSIEQIGAVLKQAELGMPVGDLIRQVGISEQTFYRWKKQYAGMQSDQVQEALRGRMREIAKTRVRYGYRHIHVLLKREGWQLGKNQMYRLYSEEQLQLRSKQAHRLCHRRPFS